MRPVSTAASMQVSRRSYCCQLSYAALQAQMHSVLDHEMLWSAEVDRLCSPFEATDEHQCDDLEFNLSVHVAHSNDTIDVTTNDLQPAHSFPSVAPVGMPSDPYTCQPDILIQWC